MSPIPSSTSLNPSQAVERIREIIVGRHLERIEQRVARLETTTAPILAASSHADGRPVIGDSPLAALKENVQRLVEANQQQTELRFSQCREETQRLALQIQQVAAMKSNESAPRLIGQLERKLGTWLTDWQSSFHVHLHDRDRRLATQLRNEVATLWESTESQLTRIESRAVDRDFIEERFHRIAVAARALAECASPSTSSSGPA
jgi:hypothetical protein